MLNLRGLYPWDELIHGLIIIPEHTIQEFSEISLFLNDFADVLTQSIESRYKGDW